MYKLRATPNGREEEEGEMSCEAREESKVQKLEGAHLWNRHVSAYTCMTLKVVPPKERGTQVHM